ncbi:MULTISPECIES: RNA methyltransferase [unclassified Halanaerobium]|uniref:TrmH family RNA methyltransferase n=1 Tax=unclassified Halanaerobium TaxID=2641197 RepID=UPI000DF23BBD|nr:MULTISPECIES: RNA methyltransferase [unclassified Halanaerobium]RCW50486.1 TrmH family RNA methyltransferase [Halanaerobium sp. MA284_MarDTE_T2]RCW85973.1 TrmH family RNA methyltransferase [Halanaerobium sp. DL-01]
MNRISSPNNSKIKYLNKLYRSRARRKEGCFVLEGKRLIEAAAGGADFEEIFVTPAFFRQKENKNLLDILQKKAVLNVVDEDIFNQSADTVNPQGIMAVVKETEFDKSTFLKKVKRILLLDRIQDPGNMGTIIRTAAASGFDGIIAAKGSVDIYNQKVLRATMGAIFSLPIWQKVDRKRIIDILKSKSDEFEIIAADVNAEEYYFQHSYKDKVIVLIGNEANGLDKNYLELASAEVKIPLAADIESLNAAVAAAILCYEIAKKDYII